MKNDMLRFSHQGEGTFGFSDEDLHECSFHSIKELNLPSRVCTALCSDGIENLGQLVLCCNNNFEDIHGIGIKYKEIINEQILSWTYNYLHLNIDSVAPEIRELLRFVEERLSPLFHIYWLDLYNNLRESGMLQEFVESSDEEQILYVFNLPEMNDEITSFWMNHTLDGIYDKEFLEDYLKELNLDFDYYLLISNAIDRKLLLSFADSYILYLESFQEKFNEMFNDDPDNNNLAILKTIIEGRTFREVKKLYGISIKKVRQAVRVIQSFSKMTEDYFEKPFRYFLLSKSDFLNLFSLVSPEGYEYLNLRYPIGTAELTPDSLKGYHGPWKKMISDALSKSSPAVCSSDESYGLSNTKPHLSCTPHLVFNRENKVRCCYVDPRQIWDFVDFTMYTDSVISAGLIYRDYSSLMQELDIRDEYELFHLIKSSLFIREDREIEVSCRMPPVLVIGNMSEEEQALNLLGEMTPVSCKDYYSELERRFGIPYDTVMNFPAIAGALKTYMYGDFFSIVLTGLYGHDLRAVKDAMSAQPIWFMDELKQLLDDVCAFSPPELFNATSLKEMGYLFKDGLVFDASFTSLENYFITTVFSEDVLDLTTLDRRLLRNRTFNRMLNTRKRDLNYIEVRPMVLMSIRSFTEMYGLRKADIRRIQEDLNPLCDLPYFNAHYIWASVENHPSVGKLEGNKFLLTCILSQISDVKSMRIEDNMILSRSGKSLTLICLCGWFVSRSGKMSLNSLGRLINDTFGTHLLITSLARKLNSSGYWNSFVTDSMDDPAFLMEGS